MSKGLTKLEVVLSAEALLAAANALPDSPESAAQDHVLAALKRYDAAENRLDDAIDNYMAAARKGTGR
jgi:hypothetical protein